MGRYICMQIGAQMPYFSPRSASGGTMFLLYSSKGIIAGVVSRSRY